MALALVPPSPVSPLTKVIASRTPWGKDIDSSSCHIQLSHYSYWAQADSIRTPLQDLTRVSVLLNLIKTEKVKQNEIIEELVSTERARKQP